MTVEYYSVINNFIAHTNWGLTEAPCSVTFGAIMAADPFRIGCHFHATNVTSYILTSTSDSDARCDAIARENNPWYNFELFTDFLSGTDKRRPSGNWKPRFRASTFGTEMLGVEEVDGTIGDIPLSPGTHHFSSYIGDDDYLDIPFTLIRDTDSGEYIASWLHLLKLANSVYDHMADKNVSSLTFKRAVTGNSKINYEFTISNLIIGRNYFQYNGVWVRKDSLNGTWQSFNSGFLKYSRHLSGYPFVDITFGISDLNITHSSCNGLSVGTHAISMPSHFSNPIIDDGDPFDMVDWSRYHRHSIIGAYPGLYLVQCQALSDMIGDISSNFESLVESTIASTAILELIRWVSITPIDDLIESVGKNAKHFPLLSKLGIVISLFKMIAGGYLAYIFAISPTLSSLKDIVARATELPQKKYEGTQSISSVDTPFSSLDEGLKAYVLSGFPISESEVSTYKVTFHVEITPVLTEQYIIETLSGSIGRMMQSTGTYPSLVLAYEAQPFTWVLENYVPIGRMSKALESYVNADRSVIRSVGYSVFVDITTTSGKHHQTYVRSDNTTTLIGPPSDVWLTPVDPSRSLVPVALIALLAGA